MSELLRSLDRAFCRRRCHSGLATFSAMFWVLMVGSIVYLFFKVLPAMNEHFTIRKVVRGIAASGPATPLDVQTAFDRQKSVEGIESISSRDLEITREDGVLVITYAYDRKIPLAGGVSLLIRYDGTTRKAAP